MLLWSVLHYYKLVVVWYTPINHSNAVGQTQEIHAKLGHRFVCVCFVQACQKPEMLLIVDGGLPEKTGINIRLDSTILFEWIDRFTRTLFIYERVLPHPGTSSIMFAWLCKGPSSVRVSSSSSSLIENRLLLTWLGPWLGLCWPV